MASKLKQPQPQPLLSDLVSGMSSVPSNYIRSANNHPNFHEVVSFDGAIPLIDLQDLNGPKRSDIIKEIGLACLNYGFFQVFSLFLSYKHIATELELVHFLSMNIYHIIFSLFNTVPRLATMEFQKQ